MKFNGAAKHYAPLPQSQSDDELFRPDEHRHEWRWMRGASIQSDGPAPSLPDPGTARRDEPKEACPESELQETTMDAPMSNQRKACFVLSLLASAFFVVGFGWLIPCRYGSLQAMESIPVVVHEWSHVFSGLVLTSNLGTSLEDDREKESMVHLGFQRYDNTEGDAYPSTVVGAMAVNGMTGDVLWQTELYASVAQQLCIGHQLCFALGNGTSSLLAAINKTDGKVLWYAHDHFNHTTLESISDMHVVPDCNEDGLPDVAVALKVLLNGDGGSTTQAPVHAVATVSQEDGRLLGAPLLLQQCTSRPRLLTALEHRRGENTTQQTDLLLYCRTRDAKGTVFRVLLADLCLGSNGSGDAQAHAIWSHPKAAGELHLATTPDDMEPSLFLAWGKGKLEKLMGPSYRTNWTTDLMLDSPVRSLMAGHFKAYSSYELFVVSDHNVHATLFQLVSAATGRVDWQMQYDGTAAQVAHLVPAISKYVDGVVVKATTPLDSSRKDVDAWVEKLTDSKYAAYLDSFYGIHHFEPKKHKLTLNTQEEQYFIVDFTNKTVDILSRLVVQQLCFNDTCSPDIFSRKENVAMQVLSHRPGSYYLALATTSANRRSNASIPHDTVVKVALLSHRKVVRRCCDD